MDEETEIALSSPTSETGLLSPGGKASYDDEYTLSPSQSWWKRNHHLCFFASTLAFLFLLVACLSAASILNSKMKAGSTPEAPSCESLSIRQEWRQLSIPARKSYLEAVKYLTTKPSRLNLTTSLYDDFTVVHKKRVYSVHHVSASLPWHRYFFFIFEQALKEECGYEGSLPYWDWTLDSKDPLASPIWDPEIGFGASRIIV